MIECICLDDNNKPNEIPNNLWIKKDVIYHITHIFFHDFQSLQGCELNELQLTEECYPYESYKLSRFGFTMENFMKLVQMMKDCSELNSIQIDELLKTEKLEIVDN